MLHSPHPRTMGRDQDFPISIEAQFLGGPGDGKPRSTMNLCTPGTDVVYRGAIHPEHCLDSTSKAFDGDQGGRAEMLVLGSGQITHLVNGEGVLQYALPQLAAARTSTPPPRPTGNRSKAATSRCRANRTRSTSARWSCSTSPAAWTAARATTSAPTSDPCPKAACMRKAPDQGNNVAPSVTADAWWGHRRFAERLLPGFPHSR
ncbi:hypothetical protein JR065_08010 [Xanthomonas sp. AmX2]|uniref:hypothetical protein n=1 Tax=Xanthomonas sp. TaxID=29446 RepID=UPI001981D53A|nr:hypothetical protein [Xanthomonas sp.]MBN6150280.1 hypothetical protein [Xanthomonas sp.]